MTGKQILCEAAAMKTDDGRTVDPDQSEGMRALHAFDNIRAANQARPLHAQVGHGVIADLIIAEALFSISDSLNRLTDLLRVRLHR